MTRSPPMPHVQLDPVNACDEAWVFSLLHHSDVSRYLCDDALIARETVRETIAASMDPSSSSSFWRIMDAMGAPAGLIGLQPPSLAANRLRAIGWRSREVVVALDPKHWGKGIAAAAVNAVAEIAGQDGVTFALIGCVDEPNARSHALMRRCGFEELGRVDGPKFPLVVYEHAV
jgi:RimJ/RimL family protein N-acetyltransferase